MEPIAELEDDDDGFGFDSSPSSHRLPNHNSNHRPESPSSVSGQFRSRSNTWPQFSVDYDKLAGNEQNEDDEEVSAMMIGMPHLHPMDDIRESEDNDDDDHSIGPPPYGTTFYELSYHHHHQHHQPDSLDPELLHQHHQAAYSPGEFSSVGGVSDGGSSQPQHHHHHHHHQQQHHHHHSHHHSTSADSHLIRQPPHSPFYSPVPGVGPNSANPASTNQSGVSGAEFSSRCDPLDISSGGVLHNGDATDDVLSGPVTEGDPAAAEGGPDGPGTASAKSASALKKNTSRRNAWGNMSYADLITQAINGSPDKRLTLSQIYEWMVQNVTYFKDKGDSNSSAGWKNSIRHNLSLHNRFMRVQNEGTGKSSWWMINPDAKPGKAARRRAISMETNNYEKRRGRVKRRVEQLRAGMAGIGRSDLSGSLGPLSSSSGSSSYKLVGSTSSLLSGNASLSNLNLSETGPSGCHSNPHLVASPSSTESFDLFSESNPLNVGNHFHSNPPNYSPSEFRPRASSNASSTCSTVNLMMDSNDNHQVTPLSPLNWNADMRVYGPNGGSYHNSSHNNVHGSNNEQLQLIDCLANLGTGPSTHNSGTGPYRMMAEKDQQMLHKNGLIGCRTSQDSSSDMMLLGSDVGSGEQAASAASHNYTDLFKMQQPQHPRLPQSTSAGAVSSSASASPISSQKPSFTSLDSPSSKASSNNLSTSYFRTPSLMDLPPSATKLHEMNNKPSGGTISYENSLHNRFADSRLSQNRLQALNSGLTSYQHHSPGKLYGLGLYTTDSGCYVPDYGESNYNPPYTYDVSYSTVSPQETLNSFAATHGAPLASGHDLDLDIDPMQSGMLDCDVDQVIRHELSVDGSLDFGLASSASNVDSSTTCSSTSTKPTSTRSPNAYTMHTTDLHLRSALDNSACYSQAMHPSPAQLSSFYSPGSSGSPTSTNGTRTYITLAPCSTIAQDEINQSKSVAASLQLLNANSRIRLSASQPTIAAAMDNLKCPTQSTTNHSTTPTTQTPSSSSASPSQHHACSLPQASAGQHRSSPNSRTSPPNTSTPISTISTISSSPHQANQNHGSPSTVPIGPPNVVDAATATITAAVVSVAANNVTAASAVTVAASSHHQQHQQHVAASQQRSWVH